MAAKSRLQKTFYSMHSRCSNSKDVRYYCYGGRGLTVCEEWKSMFEFVSWALNNGYDDTKQLDRIDNDKGYFPANCRFVTHQENNNNRSNNRLLTAFGETKTLSDWSRDARCLASETALRKRLARGWLAELALTDPLKKGHRYRSA